MHRHRASLSPETPSASHALDRFDSLQTSGSWGADAGGPFELILSKRQNTSAIPRANTHGSLHSLFKSPSPDTTASPSVHANGNVTLSPASKHIYLFGGTDSRNSSTTSLASIRKGGEKSATPKLSAWSRWTGRRLGRPTASDRLLSDKFKSDEKVSPGLGSGSAAQSQILILRATSGSSMVRWAEVISPLLAPRSTSPPPQVLNRRASFRKHQLHLSMGPSITTTMHDFEGDDTCKATLDFSAEDNVSTSTHAVRPAETSRYHLTSLLEEAGLNARRRRVESSGENSHRNPHTAGAAHQRLGRFSASAAPASEVKPAAPSSEPFASVSVAAAKKRLSRISMESSKRLSLRGDSSTCDHSRPSTANRLSRGSMSLSRGSHDRVARHHAGTSVSSQSVRNSVHSERRASSPMVLFNIFSASRSAHLDRAQDSERRSSEDGSSVQPASGTGMSTQQSKQHAGPSSGSALGLLLDGKPLDVTAEHPANHPWSQVPGRIRAPFNPNANGMEAGQPPPSPFAEDYSPSLAPTSPATPATAFAPAQDPADYPFARVASGASLKPSPGYRKPPPPRFDPKDLDAVEDRSYEIVPPATSIPVSCSMPVIAAAETPGSMMSRGKGPIARKWGKTAGKLTSKVNLPPAILEPRKDEEDENVQGRTHSPAMLVRRLGELTTSFSSRSLSSHLTSSLAVKRKPSAVSIETETCSVSSPKDDSLSTSPPTVTFERILPPEVMISRLDEISKMEPAVASIARKSLLEPTGRVEMPPPVTARSAARKAGGLPQRPSTSAGTVTSPFALATEGSIASRRPAAAPTSSQYDPLQSEGETGRPCSPWSTASLSSPLEKRSPRLALRDISAAMATNSNRTGLPAPPRLPKKRSAGPLSGLQPGNTLPRCQSSSVLAERAEPTSPPLNGDALKVSPKPSPIVDRNSAFPSPEKTSSTFNPREGKWKRHSTFSVIENQSARSSVAGRADDKENAWPGHVRDLWSLNDSRIDYGGHDDNDDSREFMGETSTSTSFTFSAYCRPSTASSRVQSQVGHVAGEGQGEDDVIEILRTDSMGRKSKDQRRRAFGSDEFDRTTTEADESNVARSVNGAEIVNVTAKWVNGQRPQVV